MPETFVFLTQDEPSITSSCDHIDRRERWFGMVCQGLGWGELGARNCVFTPDWG